MILLLRAWSDDLAKIAHVQPAFSGEWILQVLRPGPDHRQLDALFQSCPPRPTLFRLPKNFAMFLSHVYMFTFTVSLGAWKNLLRLHAYIIFTHCSLVWSRTEAHSPNRLDICSSALAPPSFNFHSILAVEVPWNFLL